MKRLALLTLMLGGCCTAQVQILPKDSGNALAVATSSEESCAYEKAQEKAREYCSKRRKAFVMVKDESEYRGMDKTAKGVMQGVGMATGKYISGDTSDDYRVRMEFKCK